MLIGPLLIALAATGFPKRPAAAVAGAALNVVLALVAAVAVARQGVRSDGTVYLDALSTTMAVLVGFVGLVVLYYSRTYLDGDPDHPRFTRSVGLTIAAVLVVVVAGNLVVLVLAWIATSLALHPLLVFYADRPTAALAARKKFLVSRFGEAALIAAAATLAVVAHGVTYGAVFAYAAALAPLPSVPFAVHAAAVLLAIAALAASASFPLHGWITEVMETPTPVSALLHAGIINAGGFLVLRFAGIVSLSSAALETLALIGGITALVGSVVMLTQTSIKVSLAYSTVAQMGFMMLECGLVAFPAALLHIVAHSLYKAHAFLASGSVIDIARASYTPSPGGAPHPLRFGLAVAIVLGSAFALARLLGVSPLQRPDAFALGAVVLLALIHLVASGIDRQPTAGVVARIALGAGAVALVFAALHGGMQLLYAAVVPVGFAGHGALPATAVVLAAIAFALVTYLQGLVPQPSATPRWRALYALAANGFYANTFANRLVLRWWPPRVAEPRR